MRDLEQPRAFLGVLFFLFDFVAGVNSVQPLQWDSKTQFLI